LHSSEGPCCPFYTVQQQGAAFVFGADRTSIGGVIKDIENMLAAA
jgi:hypothetical protein